ncbi:transglutaminase domain-containing protein [Lentisphaerota bacterium ZTH]|nr:transglutaminase domain-containing protein [Lentisphaerota bacterium]WET05663.1 transglutaminase domain-containing protein [Lentisphaerota bacterium ZTH]
MTTISNKSIKCLSLVTALLLPAAFFFSITTDLPHVTLIVLSGLFLSMLTRRPVVFSDRSVIYFIVLALVLTVLFDLVFPLKNNRLGYLSVFFYPNILVPLTMYIAVAMSFFKSGPHVYGTAAVAAVTALAFGGDVYSKQLQNTRLPVPAEWMTRFMPLFIGTIIIVGFFIIIAFRTNANIIIPQKLRKYRIRRGMLLLIILAVVPLSTVGAYSLYKRYEAGIRKLEHLLMRSRMHRFRLRNKSFFGDGVDLNQTISPDVLHDQKQIVIRAISNTAPGYLRGQVYDKYQLGTWMVNKNSILKAMRPKTHSGMLAFTTFSLPGSKGQPPLNNPIEIMVSSNLRTKVLLAPGNVKCIDIIAESLKLNMDGVFSPRDWTKEGGYTLYRNNTATESAWQQPSGCNNPMYVRLPSTLISRLDEVIASIPGMNRNDLTDRQVFDILLKFFSNNFKYKIRQHPRNGSDPVVQFLTETREGHCELFASALALLLRRSGIPSRYITGFICSEPHPSGSYFVARLGNAHAWVEAYDRYNEQWVLLEATPPSGLNIGKGSWSSFESGRDLFFKFFQKLLSDLRKGYYARAILAFFTAVYRIMLFILWHPVRGGIFLIAMFFLLRWLWKRRKKRQIDLVFKDRLPKTTAELSRTYLKIVRKLAKREDFLIKESTTAKEILVQLQTASLPQNKAAYIRLILENYQALRFREKAPSVEQIKTFKLILHKR